MVRSVLGLPLGCRRSRARRGRARVVYLTYRSRVYYINTVLTVGVLDIVAMRPPRILLRLPGEKPLVLRKLWALKLARGNSRNRVDEKVKRAEAG